MKNICIKINGKYIPIEKVTGNKIITPLQVFINKIKLMIIKKKENEGNKLEQENKQLKNTIMQLRKQVDKMKNCSNCNGIIKGGMRSERCEFCIKDKDFRYWEPAE